METNTTRLWNVSRDGQETEELNDNFGFDASKVDILVLSHAHIDHSGLIPR